VSWFVVDSNIVGTKIFGLKLKRVYLFCRIIIVESMSKNKSECAYKIRIRIQPASILIICGSKCNIGGRNGILPF